MKSPLRQTVIFVLILLGVGGVGAAVYILRPGLQSTSPQLALYGNIDIREVDLAFSISGRVDRMLVEEGDTVEQGQLLAVLETDIYDAEVEAAEARLGARRAVLDRLLAGSRPEEINEARANLRAVEAELEDARANLQRTEQLAKDNFATLQKLDGDRARVKSLEARSKAVEQALSLVVQGPRDEDIAEARAQLRADEAEVVLVQRRRAYTQLHAKDRGTVKIRIVEPGAVVLGNSPVYTIALFNPVWVRTYVSEPDLGRIHPGLKAEILTDSSPDKAYDGWVGFISPVAEFTPKSVETREVRTSLVYRIRVLVRDPGHDLRQGMPVSVRLKIEDDPPEKEKAAPQ